MEHRWDDIGRPILRYVDGRERATPGVGLSLQAEEIAAGIARQDVPEVGVTIDMLVQDQCLNAIRVTTLDSTYPEYLVQGVTPRGLERLDQWFQPAAERALQALAAGFEAQADETSDPEQRSRLRAAAVKFGSATGDVAVKVFSEVLATVALKLAAGQLPF